LRRHELILSALPRRRCAWRAVSSRPFLPRSPGARTAFGAASGNRFRSREQESLPEPRAERAEGPRERAVSGVPHTAALPVTVHGIPQRLSARKTVLPAATAHSGRRSRERRPPFAAPNQRLQSRERSGPKARGSERSPRGSKCHNRGAAPPADFPLRLRRDCACSRSSYQLPPLQHGRPVQPLTLAVVLANDGPRSRLRTNAFRAASGAGRRPAGASGQRRSAHRCPPYNAPRHFPTHISPQDGASRSNRSLWPSFSRTTAPVRGSEPTLSAPRAERAEGPRERAVSGVPHTAALPVTVHGIPQRLSARKTVLPGATAHSGRRSRERRPPFAAPNQRFQSRERSGPKARGSERSAAFRTQPPSLQRSAAFPSAYQPARRCFPEQPLTLAVVLPNAGPRSRLRKRLFMAPPSDSEPRPRQLPHARSHSRRHSTRERVSQARFIMKQATVDQ
jgi:hypothetical protein